MNKKNSVNPLELGLKKAKQNGFICLPNMKLLDFPCEITKFYEIDFPDEKWWESFPLTKLDLSNNEISIIPNNILNLKDLILFRMINNKIKELPNELFELKNLKSLDVSSNKINSIQKNIINCSSLVEINFLNNQIKEFPSIINKLENLEIINLAKNELEIFPNFSGLYKLKKLDLSENRINELEGSKLKGLISLDQLLLNKNKIIRIENDFFKDTNNLTLLDLKENKINEFNFCINAVKLDSLSLGYNNLQNFDCFESFPNLTILDLKDNKLKNIDKKIICLKLLKTLDISNNDLSDIPSELGFLSKLVRINIVGNPLRTIKPAIRSAGAEVLKKYLVSRMPELEKENVKYDKNQKIDEFEMLMRDFLINNKELCIKNKNIKFIDERVWGLNNLNVFDFSDNQIEILSDEIQNLKNLKILRLNNNKIEMINERIVELKNLQEIEIRKNKLQHFLPNVNIYKIQWDSLVLLDLSMNNVKIIPNIITNLKNLRVLQMGFNLINNIDILFTEKLANLEVLNFSNNKIDSISDEIYILNKNLNFLNIENNNLTVIPTIIGFMKTLKNIQIDGNPLKQIRRNIIEKGSVEILNYLRTRHIGSIPNEPQKGQENISNNFIVEKKKSEMEIEEIIPNKIIEEFKFDQNKLQLKENLNKQSCDNSLNLIQELEIKIEKIENEIKDNFGMNSFQKQNKKKELQQLLVTKSKLLTTLGKK